MTAPILPPQPAALPPVDAPSPLRSFASATSDDGLRVKLAAVQLYAERVEADRDRAEADYVRLVCAICGEPAPPVTTDDLVAVVDELHGFSVELAELRGLIDAHRADSDRLGSRAGDLEPETDHEVIERLARLRPLVELLAAMVHRAAREVTPRLRAGLLADLAEELRRAGIDEAGGRREASMAERCMCDWRDGCGGTGTIECIGCGGDACICRCGGETPCHGCEDCDFGEDDGFDEYDPEQAEIEELRWTCIGSECCNPHVIHTRDECFTAEMAEDFMRESEAPDA